MPTTNLSDGTPGIDSSATTVLRNSGNQVRRLGNTPSA